MYAETDEYKRYKGSANSKYTDNFCKINLGCDLKTFESESINKTLDVTTPKTSIHPLRMSDSYT
jgi:hypothetical protein